MGSSTAAWISREVASSKILLREQEVDARCQLTTALNLHHALHQRALALDLIGVATYSSVVTFNEFLMGQLQVEPPPGYASITVSQVLEADQAAWLRMERLPKGLRQGELPMDSVLPTLHSDPKVVFHLLPLPCKSASSASTRKQTDEAPDPPPFKWQRTGKGKKGKGKAEVWEASQIRFSVRFRPTIGICIRPLIMLAWKTGTSKRKTC